jgi:hypothetical protein
MIERVSLVLLSGILGLQLSMGIICQAKSIVSAAAAPSAQSKPTRSIWSIILKLGSLTGLCVLLYFMPNAAVALISSYSICFFVSLGAYLVARKKTVR